MAMFQMQFIKPQGGLDTGVLVGSGHRPTSNVSPGSALCHPAPPSCWKTPSNTLSSMACSTQRVHSTAQCGHTGIMITAAVPYMHLHLHLLQGGGP